MGQPLRKLWIGLDWGTHSSKWWYTAEGEAGNPIEGASIYPVIDSTVYRTGDRLKLVRERTEASLRRSARCKLLGCNSRRDWHQPWRRRDVVLGCVVGRYFSKPRVQESSRQRTD